MSKGTITHWIEQLKKGERGDASRALWERYYEKLVRLARRRLEAKGTPRRVAGEEDVALSAFKSFCLAARKGRFPNLSDRKGLWRLLLRMTERKAVDLIRYNNRQKHKVLGESAIPGVDAESAAGGIGQVIGDSPTPDFAVMVAENCQRLLDLLDPDLQRLAVAKLEGYTNVEIARRFDCATRTVQRQLHLIRMKWKKEVES